MSTIELLQMREEERKLLAQLGDVRARIITHLEFWNDAYRQDALEAERGHEALGEALTERLALQLPVGRPLDPMAVVHLAEEQLKLNRTTIDHLKGELIKAREIKSYPGEETES